MASAVNGKRLKMRREELKYTMKDVADALAVQIPTIYKYEHNLSDMPSDKLAAISRLLEASPLYFLGETDDINPRWAEKPYKPTNREISIALADAEMTDAQLDEIKRYAKYILEKEEREHG